MPKEDPMPLRNCSEADAAGPLTPAAPPKARFSQACWVLSCLTNGYKECISQVVDTGVLPRLVALMTSSDLNVLTPSLCTVGNIITGTDEQKQMATDVGMLNMLPQLLQHNRPFIQKEVT